MPRRSQVQTVDFKGWAKGLNREVNASLLEADESPDAKNVDFGPRGEVTRRKGYSRYDTSGLPAVPFDHVYAWNFVGGGEFLIVTRESNGDIWYATATTFTNTTFSLQGAGSERQYPVAFASLNDKLYITALRGNNPRSFDGTTWAAMTASNFDGTSARFPKARHLVVHQDRMFAANVISSGGTNYRSRLYYSNLSDAETWDALDFTDFEPDDGSEITAMASFGEDLMVFKDHSVHVLAGRSEESFTRYRLDSQIGTTSPHTVRSIGSNLYFFDRDSGVYQFDGGGFTKIDEKISSYILDGISYDDAYKAFAFVYRSKYYLCVPWGGDDFNSRTFVYDTRSGAWSEYDFGVAGATDFAGNVISVQNRDGNGAYKLFDTATDDGAGFTAEFTTAWFAPNGGASKSRTRRLDTVWDALSAETITSVMLTDYEPNASVVTQLVSTDPGTSLWDTSKWDEGRYDLAKDAIIDKRHGFSGHRWSAVAFNFGTLLGDLPWQLNTLSLQYSSQGRVRGQETVND